LVGLAHFFVASPQKNRAFRSNLLAKSQKDFRFNPLRPTGLSGFGTTSIA
jgi:hypothetical protein